MPNVRSARRGTSCGSVSSRALRRLLGAPRRHVCRASCHDGNGPVPFSDRDPCPHAHRLRRELPPRRPLPHRPAPADWGSFNRPLPRGSARCRRLALRTGARQRPPCFNSGRRAPTSPRTSCAPFEACSNRWTFESLPRAGSGSKDSRRSRGTADEFTGGADALPAGLLHDEVENLVGAIDSLDFGLHELTLDLPRRAPRDEPARTWVGAPPPLPLRYWRAIAEQKAREGCRTPR
jgi:hypothetical protein